MKWNTYTVERLKQYCSVNCITRWTKLVHVRNVKKENNIKKKYEGKKSAVQCCSFWFATHRQTWFAWWPVSAPHKWKKKVDIGIYFGSKPKTIDSKLLVKIQSCYWELWICNSYFFIRGYTLMGLTVSCKKEKHENWKICSRNKS